MTVMYSFCFWYSVRLGSIIVGVSCIVQCLAILIACGLGMGNLEATSSQIEVMMEANDLLIAKAFCEAVRDDPKGFLLAFIVVFFVYFWSCVLLIYAAFQCNGWLMYPFMVLEFVRLVAISLILAVILILLKGNTLNLGVIIGCSIAGAFVLLYMWYQWFCTVSLWQIIREVDTLDLLMDSSNPADKGKEYEEDRGIHNASYFMA